MDIRILRRPQVLQAVGYSNRTLHTRISERLFTRSVQIGPRAVGWPAHEVAAINAARVAGKTDDEIRQLVADLEARRKPVAA